MRIISDRDRVKELLKLYRELGEDSTIEKIQKQFRYETGYDLPLSLLKEELTRGRP